MFSASRLKITALIRGGFRKGADAHLYQGFDPLPNQRRQYLLILRGERAPKKLNFLVKIFQKVPKNAFFACFFKNLPVARKILPNWGKTVLLEILKNQFGRPKKKALEKILDPPLALITVLQFKSSTRDFI